MSMKVRGTITVAATVLALVGTAQGATLFTPALNVPLGENSLECHIVNVSTQDRTVTILALDFDGVALQTVGPFTVEPGRNRFVSAPATVINDVNNFPRYCKFIVEGGKTNYRASACVFQSLVGCIATIPAD